MSGERRWEVPRITSQEEADKLERKMRASRRLRNEALDHAVDAISSAQNDDPPEVTDELTYRARITFAFAEMVRRMTG